MQPTIKVILSGFIVVLFLLTIAGFDFLLNILLDRMPKRVQLPVAMGSMNIQEAIIAVKSHVEQSKQDYKDTCEGKKTVNQIRVDHGLKPLGDGDNLLMQFAKKIKK